MTLVAAPVETESPFSGAFLIEDGQCLVDAVRSGDWLEGGVAAFSALIDTAAAVIDPIGTLIANGLGWVLDHLEPLKGWLNDFTGNPGEVAGFAQTWDNVAARLRETGEALLRRTDDVAELSGAAIDAYLDYAAGASRHLAAAGDWAAAIATGMRVASQLVQVVHDVVRDAVAQVVGTALAVAAETALTLGIAAPFAIGQVTARVASVADTVGRAIVRLQRGFRELVRLIGELRELFARGGKMLDRMLRGDEARVALAGEAGGVPGIGVGEAAHRVWAREAHAASPAPGTGGDAWPSAASKAAVRALFPDTARFSQKTVSFRKFRDGFEYTYDDIVTVMVERGWIFDPIDVVRMSDGELTSMDNTRLRAAVETGTPVDARVHEPSEPLTTQESERFFWEPLGKPRTWEEAALIRVAKQRGAWARENPNGTFVLPRVTGRPNGTS
ncbi:hypothetical protein PU630_00345 [Microbacterium horticulturae]|uniref:WXG100 family type VII secretion target n=1 Tax=Microbacterium horticulturae TaxID=3028316 RepID=A0ABY8BZZ0_9MICO|nr:hypothetical protein [Microbacterium sp. KACC 23027]WEG09047.1 hypothetical protein PU630_00345 [Microbacterium sp. KACC 23027]